MSTPLHRFSNLMALAVPAAGILTCGQADAADFFLKLDGIEGESRATGFEKQIQVLSWSWGMSNAGTASGGGAGKATFKEFTITKRLSSASPPLMLSCATGTHIPSATFRLTQPSATGRAEEYYIVTLQDVVVSGYSSSRSEPSPTATDTYPVESVSLNFTKMHIEYRPAAVNGQVSPPVTATVEVATP